MPAKAKLTDAQVRKLRRRLGAGARLSELAAEYKVNRKTIRRRLDALERAEAERTVADRAEEKWMKRLRGRADRKPERAPEQRPGERRDRSQASRPRLHQASSARLRSAGVPRFPNTPEGRAERLAYYDARKLNRRTRCSTTTTCSAAARRQPSAGLAKHAPAAAGSAALDRERSRTAAGAGAGSGCRTRAEARHQRPCAPSQPTRRQQDRTLKGRQSR